MSPRPQRCTHRACAADLALTSARKAPMPPGRANGATLGVLQGRSIAEGRSLCVMRCRARYHPRASISGQPHHHSHRATAGPCRGPCPLIARGPASREALVNPARRILGDSPRARSCAVEKSLQQGAVALKCSALQIERHPTLTSELLAPAGPTGAAVDKLRKHRPGPW